MVIDFHTHIFPDKIAAKTIEHLEKAGGIRAATDGTLNGLLSSMERCGVDLSVILPVATKPSQFENIQSFAKSINEQYPGKLLSFGGIHPDCEDYKKELDTIKARFRERMHGHLPPPVEKMLEARHGMYDALPCNLKLSAGYDIHDIISKLHLT